MYKRNNSLLYFRLLLLVPAFLICGCSSAEPSEGPTTKHSSSLLIKKVVVSLHDTTIMDFINDEALYKEGWDSLAQPRFWKNVMNLSPDSAIINISSTRMPLGVIDYNQWMKQKEGEKIICKKNYCTFNNIDLNTDLFITNGRKDFFEHRKSLEAVNKAINIFLKNGVDPWFAQTILLIESPGKNIQKSWAGAQGPFQLMRDVAIRFGLKVNKKVDQRTDLNYSAKAASLMISKVCIPKVKIILDSLNITYSESDIWFRLLVLHAYHAGPGNIACALYSLAPMKGGIDLIRNLWQTQCRGFKNESQNYSQLALAAHLSFNDILGKPKDTVFLVQGDRQYFIYKKQQLGKHLSVAQLMDCFNLYGKDVVDGTINADYYIKKINKVRKEMNAAGSCSTDHDYIMVSNELMRKRKVDDAIKLLRFTIEEYPHSAMAADSLSHAYKISGNNSLALKYERISVELNKSTPQ